MKPNSVEARFITPSASHITSDPIRPNETTQNVPCPYCRSNNTEFFSLFGQQLLTEQYYCNNCHTPFEYIKDDVQVFPKG